MTGDLSGICSQNRRTISSHHSVEAPLVCAVPSPLVAPIVQPCIPSSRLHLWSQELFDNDAEILVIGEILTCTFLQDMESKLGLLVVFEPTL